MRKKFFDDRIFYDRRQNLIFVGRPDSKTQGEPWQWIMVSKDRFFRPHKIPDNFVEIGREPEFSMFKYEQDL